MNHRIHENSHRAYQGIIDTLPASRAKVMACIVTKGSVTRQGIADELGIPINRVTGRVRELLDMKLIFEGGNLYIDGKPRAILIAAAPEPQQRLF